MTAHPDLLAHGANFEKSIHRLSENVYTAVGYAASNVHLLVGEEGAVVIDTTESTRAAENILAAFRAITDLPVRTIILTHSHRDHISGARVFTEGREVEVIAADNFSSDLVALDEGRPAPNAALMARTRAQFGIGLAPDERVNIGLGPGDRPMEGLGAGYLPPTRRIGEGATLVRERFELELFKAPGETPDHLAVWLGARRILFCGDNFYHAFPNLYAIRGTPYRDFDAWSDTMDLLLARRAEVLAPGHTLPVFGEKAIAERLTDYRDAIRHVVAATCEGMNAGLDPVTIADGLRLPERLAGKPWLREFYGHVGHASRAYFAGTLGWFDGNPTRLAELPPAEEARRVIALAGGPERVEAAARAALEEGAAQWAMELADRLIAEGTLAGAGRAVKLAALRRLADATINAPMRNYYLRSARDLDGGD